jgi:hypothetical protein
LIDSDRGASASIIKSTQGTDRFQAANMAAVWRRAWRSKKVSSTGLGSGGGGGGSLWPISDSTTTTITSGTTFSTTTTYTTISSNPVGEGLDLDAMEFKEELVETRRHLRGLVEEFCGGANGNVTAP